jgi:hypothetical protein
MLAFVVGQRRCANGHRTLLANLGTGNERLIRCRVGAGRGGIGAIEPR